MKARTFPCKGCGANLEFDPDAASLKCPYCQRIERIPETAEEIDEYEFDDYLARPQKFGYGKTGIDVTCKGCGAVTHVAAETLSGTCPYCSKPYTVEQREVSDHVIAPETLVPFRLSRNDAAELFRKWVQGLWFAPGALKRQVAAGSENSVELEVGPFSKVFRRHPRDCRHDVPRSVTVAALLAGLLPAVFLRIQRVLSFSL